MKILLVRLREAASIGNAGEMHHHVSTGTYIDALPVQMSFYGPSHVLVTGGSKTRPFATLIPMGNIASITVDPITVVPYNDVLDNVIPIEEAPAVEIQQAA